MKKILIIGPGGAGKSTFSLELGSKLGLEVLHLDQFYWSPGWVESQPEKWEQTVAELVSRDSWIIDGNYSRTLSQRIDACDTIVFLDLPTILCLWRIIKRRILYRDGSRPDMAEGCREKFDLEFILWVAGYSCRSRPKVVKLLRENVTSKKIIWLRSRREVSNFLLNLQSEWI